VLLSPPRVSCTALKSALSEHNIHIDIDAAADILMRAGLLDPTEYKDLISEDKSYFAEKYSYTIAKNLKISPLTCYNVLRSFEELFLNELFFKAKCVTIPHACELLLDGKKLSMRELSTPVREKIDSIINARKTRNKLLKIKRAEKRSKKNGN
jgi:hypothetical protein